MPASTMSLPTDLNRLYFYYAIGNTPAISLTRHLNPETNARALLLGSGDLRNVMFTCFADGAPERALDLTLCDHEPGVVGEFILDSVFPMIYPSSVLIHKAQAATFCFFHWSEMAA